MTPDPGQRLAAALNEMQVLGVREMERYLRALRASDPEVAGRLEAMLNIPVLEPNEGTALDAGHTPSSVGPLAEPSRREPHPLGEPTVSADARGTASFLQPGPPPACAGPELPAGQILGRYQLLRVVGQGAFGEVWKAFDPVLEMHVALKVSRPNRSMEVAAFLDEARKAASLRHDAIIRVHDVCANADGWYIISEFIEGENLRTRIAAGRVPLEHAVRIVARVAEGLHAAHLTGLVHRDVKPGNILLDRAGNAYLIDFGLAVREEDQFAERSKVSGTLAYMPPEQISGDTHLLDGRADIYALGAVLYELLTGRPVFRAADIDEYRELILRREPRPPRAVETTVPEELERICLKCLAKAVKDRYRTARDVAADLENWLAGSTRSVELPAAGGRVRGRWKLAAVSAVAVALGAGIIGVATLGGGKPQPTPPERNGDTKAGAEPARKVPAVKELLWMTRGGPNEWKVLSEKELQVITESTSLLQLGETSVPNWSLTATFRQVGAVGRVGLFLGYRRDAKTQLATYEVLKFRVSPNKVDVHRVIESYPLDQTVDAPHPTICGGSEIKNARDKNTLRLVVRNNLLSEVHVNGVPLDGLFNAGPRPSAAGPFGVYNQKSDALVSYPLFNDNLIPLLVDAKPSNSERP